MASSPNKALINQIQPLSGQINMPALSSRASFQISIVNDDIPEFATWFYVNLTSITSGGVLEQARDSMNITMVESDYPYGILAFAIDSR